MTSESGFDFIHCIYDIPDNVYYMKMTPENPSYSDFRSHRLNDNGFTTLSAYFTQTITGTVGDDNSYTGYQAFISGTNGDFYFARQ